MRLLGIRAMIDEYNCHKGDVDRFDQCRSYYSTQQVKYRTWRPLLYFLLDVTVNNAWRLSSYASARDTKRSGHKKFLYKLIEQLFERGERLCNGSYKRARDEVILSTKESAHKSVRLFANAKTCVACAQNGRRGNASAPPRIPLQTTSGNNRSIKRTRRTSYGCCLCKTPLCRPEVRSECWQEHLQRHKTITEVDTSTSSIIK